MSKTEIDDFSVSFKGSAIKEVANSIDLSTNEKIISVMPRCKQKSAYFELEFLIRVTDYSETGIDFFARRKTIAFTGPDRLGTEYEIDPKLQIIKSEFKQLLGLID